MEFSSQEWCPGTRSDHRDLHYSHDGAEVLHPEGFLNHQHNQCSQSAKAKSEYKDSDPEKCVQIGHCDKQHSNRL